MVKFRGVSSSPFFYDAGPEIFALARTLRTNMTNAEKLLWKQIGYKRMEGYHFRRQHPLGRIIVDFFCWEAKLVIEVDGEIHKTPYQKERDVERTNITSPPHFLERSQEYRKTEGIRVG